VVRHDDDDEGAREEQRTRRGWGEALRLRSSADGEREPEVERSSAGRAGTERTAVQQIVDGSRPAERRGTGAAPRVAQRETTGCRGARQPRRELQTRGSSPERSRRARARWPGSGAAAATARRWCRREQQVAGRCTNRCARMGARHGQTDARVRQQGLTALAQPWLDMVGGQRRG